MRVQYELCAASNTTSPLSSTVPFVKFLNTWNCSTRLKRTKSCELCDVILSLRNGETKYSEEIPYTTKLSKGKTFAVHQPHAIMYCTQRMIQGENFRDSVAKNRKKRKSFAVYGMQLATKSPIY